MISALVFARLIITSGEVIAIVGLVGTLISSMAGVWVAWLNRQKIMRIEHKTDAVKETARQSMDSLRERGTK